MEFEPSVVAWKSRVASQDEALVDVKAVTEKDGSKLLLLTTLDGVLEYCTNAKKSINHWTFRAKSVNALSVGAQKLPARQVYFGGRSSTGSCRLVCWRQRDLDVAKWRNVPLNGEVHELFVHPQFPEECMVLFKNGDVAFYDEDLVKTHEFRKSQDLQEPSDDHDDDQQHPPQHIEWAALTSDQRNPLKGNVFLAMMVSRNNVQHVVIYEIAIGKHRRKGEVSLACVCDLRLDHEQPPPPPPQQQSSPRATCGVFHAETLSFSVIWSNGQWEMLQFTRNAVTHSLELAQKKQVFEFNQAGASPTATSARKKRKLDNKAEITNDRFVASSIGNFCYMVVAKCSAATALMGWDAKFGVQVARGDVLQAHADSSSSTVPTGKLIKIVSTLHGEAIVAAYEHAVFLINVRNKHSTLASVLGIMKHSKLKRNDNLENQRLATQQPPHDPLILKKDWLQQVANMQADEIDAAKWQQQVCDEASGANQSMLRELCDASASLSEEEFVGKVNRLATHLNKTKCPIPTCFVMDLTARLLSRTDDATWKEPACWQVLKLLVLSRRLSARGFPTLLPLLMQHKQFKLLQLAIENLTDIDERNVVRLVKFLLRTFDSAKLQQQLQSSAANGLSSSASELMLCRVLALPTNGVFLQRAIRQLSLEEVGLLLTFCAKFLLVDARQEEDKDNSSSNPVAATTNERLSLGGQLTSLQICEWINGLLDGHLATLILSASRDQWMATLLQQIDALVHQQMTNCEQFEQVQHVVGNFLTGIRLPQSHGIPDYSIEQLELAN